MILAIFIKKKKKKKIFVVYIHIRVVHYRLFFSFQKPHSYPSAETKTRSKFEVI